MQEEIKSKEFEELEFEEQCKIVYETPLARKGDLVIRSQDPERMINSFSAEEFYLTLREMDSTNVPEIIQFANLKQLQFMSDFECWQGDIINEKGFLRWLEYLEQTDSAKLELWLLNADFCLMIAGFQKYITVLKPFHEEAVDEVIGDKPYFTLDGLYYIMINEENMEIVKRAIETLFVEARHYYVNLLEGIMSEMDALVEEEAFRLRQVRLEEKGFPSREIAFCIYKIIDAEEWNRDSWRRKRSRDGIRASEQLPLYPTKWQQEKLFLDDVLATLIQASRDVQRDIYQEIVWLCNKIIICDGMDNFGEKQVTTAFNHARHILSIALENLSSGDIEKAHEILTQRWIEYIFRWGFTLLVHIRDAAEKPIKSYWDYSLKRLCEFLDEPLGPLLRGIMTSRPRWYDVSVAEDLFHLRDFKNWREVEEAAHAIVTVENTLKFLSTKPCNGWTRYMNISTIAVQIDPADIKLSTLILTLFAHFCIDGLFSLKPLSEEEFKRFIKISFLGNEQSSQIKNFRPDLKADFVKELFMKTKSLSQQEFHTLKTLFEVSFRKGEEELGLLNMHMQLNVSFIQGLLLEASKNN